MAERIILRAIQADFTEPGADDQNELAVQTVLAAVGKRKNR
ncbi:hypothetical protein [Noviherbaspirillum soli]|nr:hypothetical protein [Noviherbaspirillum soli]